jgi:alcohol dehydrogenase class IV
MMHSGLGLAHAVANTVGGWYHEAAHGMVIGHLLEEVVRFNSTVCRARCDRISEAVHSTGELFRSECARLGLRPLTLAAGDLPRLVSRSSSNLNAKTNPRDFTEADVKGLLHACFAVQD